MIENQSRKRVLTGARPSGSPHLGNYYGAFAQAIRYQDERDLFFFLADFHALNASIEPGELTKLSLDLVAVMLACGLDPNKACFYAQSTVPQVHELSWILSCQASAGMLMRAHSFKDATAKSLDVNMGVFNYPILMAADILLYDADFVPVGKDQKQHLEYARDWAQRFNHHYKSTLLKIPEPMILEEVAVVPGTDGQKMSKSKNNVISLFATDKEWKKQIQNIVTDSKSLEESKDPSTCTVVSLYKLLASKQEVLEMEENYRKGGYGYGHAKLALLEAMKRKFSAMRDKYFDIRSKEDYLVDVIFQGSKKARLVADKKLEAIRHTVGVLGGKLS